MFLTGKFPFAVTEGNYKIIQEITNMHEITNNRKITD